MDTSHLINELAALVGAENAQAEATDVALPAGWPARPVASIAPGTPDEVVEVVRVAEAAGVAIVPCGGGTQLQTGYPPRADKPYLLLRTTRLNRLLDYQPDDLTVTCEPGLTLAALQETLATRRQFLPIDPPLPERATLGGIVSANATGFWRPAYGAPRDLVIGLRAVMTEGVAVKGGGKVVKNVAGYDVCKLFTGAWGTLGFLTEITFKVRTRPEAEQTLAWDAPDVATAARIGLRLHQTRLAATYLLATNEPDYRPRLILGLQGMAARVEWQAVEFTRLAADAGLTTPPTLLSTEEVAQRRNTQARLSSETPIAARLSGLPADLPALVQALEADPALLLTAHCATGILSLAATDPDPAIISKVKAARKVGANLVWTRLDGDPACYEGVEVWGETQEEFALHRALKRSLDPKDTFGSGRFLGKL